MAEWTREQQQIAALASLCGTLIGALKVNGTLTEDMAESILVIADEVLPDHAISGGSEALAIVRSAMRSIEPPKD